MQKLTLMNQEQEGNYDFNVEIMCSKGFKETFGEDVGMIAKAAIDLINKTYLYPDYLQVLYYGNIKFWVIANYEKNFVIDEASIIKNCVDFILPHEY